MATIDELLAQGGFEIGDINPKTRIAPVTQSGKPCLIALSKSHTLQTPWQISSFDGRERCSCDLLLTDNLARLADPIGAPANSM